MNTNRWIIFVLALLPYPVTADGENWPAWRGPRGDGTSLEQNIPTVWNAELGKNIAWQVPIPGVGHSSPIVWQDRIFVVSCLQEANRRVLICLDRKTGETLWQRTILEAVLEKKHTLNSFASGTPLTDGKLVYTSFLDPDFSSKNERTPGDMVVAAYDFAGNQKWLVRPGRFASRHGFCSSPILYEDKIIVNGDHDGDSYIVALDRKSGQTVWKIDRENKTRSYVTPIIRNIDGRRQMILSGDKCIASYDPQDGSRHWIIRGPTEQYVASLVYNNKLLFMTAGFPERHILAIRPDGRGDVTDTHVVWRTRKNCSYVPSPIVVGDYFLVAADNGVASCYDADTGTQHWAKRLANHNSASLVTSGGLVYFLADNGETTVVRPGKTLDIVAKNPLGDFCFASPAISNGQIFVRGEKRLFCIGEKGAECIDFVGGIFRH